MIKDAGIAEPKAELGFHHRLGERVGVRFRRLLLDGHALLVGILVWPGFSLARRWALLALFNLIGSVRSK